MERETGLEPATIYMASRCSTTELLPHDGIVKVWWAGRDLNPHGSHHQILNLARLPFRHPPWFGVRSSVLGTFGPKAEHPTPNTQDLGRTGLEPVAR
jgi:hypothetical protein